MRARSAASTTRPSAASSVPPTIPRRPRGLRAAGRVLAQARLRAGARAGRPDRLAGSRRGRARATKPMQFWIKRAAHERAPLQGRRRPVPDRVARRLAGLRGQARRAGSRRPRPSGARLLVFPEYGAMELASLFPEPVPGDLRAPARGRGLARGAGGRAARAPRPPSRRPHPGRQPAGRGVPGRFHNRARLYGPDGGHGVPGQDRDDPLRARGLGRLRWPASCGCSTPRSAASASASATTSSSRCSPAAWSRPVPS